MSACRRVLVAALLVAAAGLPAAAANRYDPRLAFRAIATPRFTVYFHQREEAMARRLAAIAEEVADRVAADIGSPSGRVHVVLVDQTDLSNGWAVPAPYNLIEITAAAPPGAAAIGNADDWLRLVFAHEYTHIVHLDKARGWVGGLRGVFGRAPVLYPNLFLPLWQIEGMATYNESAVTGEGRVPAGDFRLTIDRAAAAQRFDPLDRVSGGLVDWPGGTAQYVYGAYFHQYLADKYGRSALVRLADETSGRLPYFGAGAFRKVFGRSLGALWEDFAADAGRRAQEEVTERVRLTRHGFQVGAAAFGPSGRLFYSVANPHGFPSLMELPRDRSAPRAVTTRYLGGRTTAAGDLLVFDQLEIVHDVAAQSDLYAVGADGGEVRRLTKEARAADPDMSPDGRTIVCTVQSADRRALATLRLPPPGTLATPVALLSDAGVDYDSPRWSPDGRRIAVERRRVGGPSEIVLVDAATAAVNTVVSSGSSRNVAPFWLSDDTLLFASDRGGGPFGIFRVDLATGALRRLGGAGLSAQSPLVSPDGLELVYVGYTADGYDLFSLPLAAATWTDVEAEPVTGPERETSSGAPVAVAATPYRPWRTLAPRFWMPVLDSDAGELSAGALTGGSDALGRHGYDARVTWAAARARPDWSIGYVYDRWRPTLFATVSDDTDPWRGGEIHTRELNLGALVTARRVRRTHAVLAAFSALSDAFDCAACPTPVDTVTTRRAIRLGWSFSSARTYGYSVSRETGTAVRATWEIAPAALGSDAGTGAATVDARGYRQAGPRHAVLALRGAAASAWGNRSARRTFSAAGAGPQELDFKFGRNAIGLLRGLPSDAVVGTHAVVANLDYRLPVWSVERGVGTAPFFFRTFHAAVFADAGQAWEDRFRSDEMRVTAGAELSLDAVVGYALPLTFATGVAWRNDPGGAAHGMAVFGRIGRAF